MSSTLAAHHRASRTAYDCAAARAVVYATTGLRSFDYLASDVVRIGSASYRARLGVALLGWGAYGFVRALVARTSPGADVFMFARQAVADDMIRDALGSNPQTQVVILGAGLDTSGLRIGAERREWNLHPGKFFEVDLPAMQNEKRRITRQFVQARTDLDEDHIVYVPCSFGENELSAALRDVGFDRLRPTIWIWSGVIHYLSEEAVDITMSSMRDLSATGSQLFFDFILLEAYASPNEYGFARTKRRFDAFGEVMSFGFRQGADHVGAWLNEQGLSLIRIYTNLDMVELYQRKTGYPAPSLGTPWSNLCMAEF